MSFLHIREIRTTVHDTINVLVGILNSCFIVIMNFAYFFLKLSKDLIAFYYVLTNIEVFLDKIYSL